MQSTTIYFNISGVIAKCVIVWLFNRQTQSPST